MKEAKKWDREEWGDGKANKEGKRKDKKRKGRGKIIAGK